ncbi:hypothetical protein [Pseudoxanthomonas kaohsiungensis]|uniref:Uncharacterized protein n=1 Tax=Pseudoxanthomonas kaohsiungensis TaxID=283923 RepID=A0ABW3M110_9GAMM|nr:hypothetical protein [Pseudoxanthomonas kaohsiungensis]
MDELAAGLPALEIHEALHCIAATSEAVAKRPRLTQAMWRVLFNIKSGRGAAFGVQGRSQHGGLVSTLFWLRKRGLVDEFDVLTPAGLAVVDGKSGHQTAGAAAAADARFAVVPAAPQGALPFTLPRE